MPDIPNQNNADSYEFKGKCKTGGGTYHWQGDEGTLMTQHGYLPFFSEYLSAGGLFSNWVADCPLKYTSNNAPAVGDVLGTALLSVLSGHTRYQHAASLLGDEAAAKILGVKKLVSHDSMARGIAKMDEQDALSWMQKHLGRVYEPLLNVPYVLDMDPTVKPIYGNQEGAAQGYNPAKPGRPSHCYHTYFIATIRLVVNVDVQPGNKTAGKYSHPGLWNFLDSLPLHLRPSFVRGDIAYGNEGTMVGCEARGVPYLFKVKQSGKVKVLIDSLSPLETKWKLDLYGWNYFETTLCLSGWSRSRRIVVLRRQVNKKNNDSTNQNLHPAGMEQLELPMTIPVDEDVQYEWAILVTSLTYDASVIGQLYRDRGDCENILDELKNQWGWCGFTSQRLATTRIMALIIALGYNWWNVFCRLAEPQKHMEAITSRPGLQLMGRLVSSGREKMIRLCIGSSAARNAMEMLNRVNSFISSILCTATQLKATERWAMILTRAFMVFLDNKRLSPLLDGDQWILLPK